MNRLKNIPAKTKFKLLLWSIPIIIVILYQLGVSRTIYEITTYKNLKVNLKESDLASRSEQLHQLNNRQLLEKYRAYVLDTVQHENNLFSAISEFSDHETVKLVEYKMLGIDTISIPKTITRKITIRGGYKEILKLIHFLEIIKQPGRISSVTFKSSKDQKTDSIYLESSMYIQNLIK